MWKITNFRKKHFTWFVLGEALISIIVIFFMMFLTKVSVLGTSVDEELYVISSSYQFAYLDVTNFAWILPLIVSIICLIYILAVIVIKNGLKKPILARKVSRPYFACSVVAFIVDVILVSMFSRQQYVSNGVMYEYNHRLALIISLLLQTLITVDAYNWKSDFGLENFYGSSDSIYK